MVDDNGPPIYLAVDVWQALGGDPMDFPEYYERNGWGGTWAALMHYLRVLNGASRCGAYDKDIEGPCVLLGHDETSPHYGADDVGRDDPLPFVVRSPRD